MAPNNNTFADWTLRNSGLQFVQNMKPIKSIDIFVFKFRKPRFHELKNFREYISRLKKKSASLSVSTDFQYCRISRQS
jgi:hypothetical protein